MAVNIDKYYGCFDFKLQLTVSQFIAKPIFVTEKFSENIWKNMAILHPLNLLFHISKGVSIIFDVKKIEGVSSKHHHIDFKIACHGKPSVTINQPFGVGPPVQELTKTHLNPDALLQGMKVFFILVS